MPRQCLLIGIEVYTLLNFSQLTARYCCGLLPALCGFMQIEQSALKACILASTMTTMLYERRRFHHHLSTMLCTSCSENAFLSSSYCLLRLQYHVYCEAMGPVKNSPWDLFISEYGRQNRNTHLVIKPERITAMGRDSMFSGCYRLTVAADQGQAASLLTPAQDLEVMLMTS